MRTPTGTQPLLFVSLPESGLLNPMLVLAGELSRRGVPDLWFATDEPRRHDVLRTGTGSPVRFASLGDVIPGLSAQAWDNETYRAVTQRSRFRAHRAIIRQSFDPQLQTEKYRRLAEIIDEVRPALLVIDVMCGYAVDLAIARSIPFVVSNPYLPSMWLSASAAFAPSYTPSDFPTPHTGYSNRMTPAQRVANRLFRLRTLGIFLRPRMTRMLAEDRRRCELLGIPRQARHPLAKIKEAAAVLCYSLAEIDYPFDIPDHVALVGAMVPPLPQAPGGELTGWLDRQSSVVYIGLGTITRLTGAEIAGLVEVARRLRGRHSVLWKLSADQRALLESGGHDLPDNLRLEEWVPSQLDVLAHRNVRVFLTHAGSNGFHESLYFGTPMVTRPLWADCHDVAVRGADAGVSVNLDSSHGIDVDSVVAKLTEVLENEEFARRAREFSRRQRSAGGRVAAADRLLALIEPVHSRLRSTDTPPLR